MPATVKTIEIDLSFYYETGDNKSSIETADYLYQLHKKIYPEKNLSPGDIKKNYCTAEAFDLLQNKLCYGQEQNKLDYDEQRTKHDDYTFSNVSADQVALPKKFIIRIPDSKICQTLFNGYTGKLTIFYLVNNGNGNNKQLKLLFAKSGESMPYNAEQINCLATFQHNEIYHLFLLK